MADKGKEKKKAFAQFASNEGNKKSYSELAACLLTVLLFESFKIDSRISGIGMLEVSGGLETVKI